MALSWGLKYDISVKHGGDCRTSFQLQTSSLLTGKVQVLPNKLNDGFGPFRNRANEPQSATPGPWHVNECSHR